MLSFRARAVFITEFCFPGLLHYKWPKTKNYSDFTHFQYLSAKFGLTSTNHTA